MLKHPFHEEMQELTVMVGGESCQPRRGWLPPHWKFAGKVLQLSRAGALTHPFGVLSYSESSPLGSSRSGPYAAFRARFSFPAFHSYQFRGTD